MNKVSYWIMYDYYLILQERAEWINSIIQQLWPNVGHYTRKIINDTVEPEVKKALNAYNLTGFKFEKVVLGKKKNRKTSKISLNFSMTKALSK